MINQETRCISLICPSRTGLSSVKLKRPKENVGRGYWMDYEKMMQEKLNEKYLPKRLKRNEQKKIRAKRNIREKLID